MVAPNVTRPVPSVCHCAATSAKEYTQTQESNKVEKKILFYHKKRDRKSLRHLWPYVEDSVYVYLLFSSIFLFSFLIHQHFYVIRGDRRSGISFFLFLAFVPCRHRKNRIKQTHQT